MLLLLETFQHNDEKRAESIDEELNYTVSKIKENFSNYSALHFFTKYINLKR